MVPLDGARSLPPVVIVVVVGKKSFLGEFKENVSESRLPDVSCESGHAPGVPVLVRPLFFRSHFYQHIIV
jgi:hypothetical protein